MNATRKLSNGIEFTPHSLRQPFLIEPTRTGKIVPKDLANVLAKPTDFKQVQPGAEKIYLGDSTDNPGDPKRYPIYLPTQLLFTHVLIAGAIGSGKTSLLLRLLAGALKINNSVVISEAKAGKHGSAEGAAFTDLAKYLEQKFPKLRVYRWPRGNCWFNPLRYLKSPQDRRAFLDALCNQIESSSVSGDMVAYIYNAASIAEIIITYLQDFCPEKCTLSRLVTWLQKPIEILKELRERQESGGEDVAQLKEIEYQLKMLNFFYMEKQEFVMTRHGVNFFTNLFNHEDLLRYSEPQANLCELQVDDILYNWSLVIVSQPLYDPASRVVGPLFWDSLLARAIELGPNPLPQAGKERQKVVAVLDETHRLPVGRLGESGDFLREYNLGLVEITPTIVDEQRWLRNQHIYQTLISLSPGVPAVVDLMRSRLPNFFIQGPGYVNTTIDSRGQLQSNVNLIPNYKHLISEDNPGVSTRSLQMTGQFTALLQSFALDGQGKLFWIDFENELMAQIKKLLKDALSPNCPPDIKQAVDYALGLAEYSY